MRVRILGTAAGGGVPQWNCACHGCAAARAHPSWRRLHASIALEASEGRWYVVNATPDIAEQIEANPDLHPGPERRRTPVAGVVLTDAELDHTLGLPRLREASGLHVLATGTVRDALARGLRLDRVLAPYTALTWSDLPEDGTAPLGGTDGLEVRAVRVSGKRPRYAADLDVPDGAWSVALHVTDRRSGAGLVYAPALAGWPPALDRALAEAACVIVDGTFWDDDEPRRSGFTQRTATEMGHLPISGPDGTAERLAALPAARRLYTHLNNTNPLVDPGHDGHRTLAGMGIEVASEGQVIEL
ncbi:pyrroloquinoline quinone biosynthesis protein PqqB [Actinomadura opuntiae]|uniref:pyrroloquinoline quinone biosynthesis protein PqqB n=1 Tax=Actinomadura sp. OS1-43 TaxID=604315 RepID=UPI00255B0055|nr:pyrroloquinoline quinone biosynthesis protein PqqB [Actinomadura sp. OS1-43]MDL4814311.1 pyrroloquinoline quinone biosynthesis protein PqqB [Actinomadura sp. OS1-43]